jgi:hypothetical protein
VLLPVPSETMAHVAATNIASQIRGQEPTMCDEIVGGRSGAPPRIRQISSGESTQSLTKHSELRWGGT